MNLLTALDALLEENSVTAAAERLHLTPPAVSRTLSRLRHAMGDDILVRTGRTMTPTPHALSIRAEVHALVLQAAGLLRPHRELDLETLDRRFTIRGHDALIGALAPALVGRLATAAPQAAVRFLAETAADSTELARGGLDLELGASEPTLPEIGFTRLGSDRLVAVFRRGHALSRGRLTAERFAEALHVAVSRRGRLTGSLDAALAAIGLSRRVVASLPTAGAALELAAGSDFVAVVPETVCRRLAPLLGLVVRPVPLEIASIPLVMAWHRRHDSDPAHGWLRRQVAEVLGAALAG